MDKLNKNIYFDLKKNFFRLGFYSNSLLLNKKVYLLYNMWDRKKKFFLLTNNKKSSILSTNFLSFTSLNKQMHLSTGIKFDYFLKWNSSSIYLNDIIIKNYYNSTSAYNNFDKYMVEHVNTLDYNIFDNVFDEIIFRSKSRILYIYKNNFFSDFFFKLTKKKRIL